MLPGVVRYTFIIFGLFTKPNLCPLTQNSGEATGSPKNCHMTIQPTIAQEIYLISAWFHNCGQSHDTAKPDTKLLTDHFANSFRNL